MNLENRLFYRLVNALYYFSMSLAILVSIFIAFIISDNGFLWGALWAGIFYTTLNITREGLLYIAFGKRLTWDWVYQVQHVIVKIKKQLSSSNSIVTDPAAVAGLPVKMLFDLEKPFSNLKSYNVKIPDKLEGTAFCAMVGYALYIYLLLIRNKFGNEIALIVKQHMVTLLNQNEETGKYIAFIYSTIAFSSEFHDSPEVNLLVEDSPEEFKTASHFLITLPNNPYYLPEEKRSFVTYREVDEHCGVETIVALTECLSYAKKQTIQIFKPMISSLSFKPESISGLRVFEEIAWSRNPGCFEKHLQRKVNNPLFSPDKREITQLEVDLARMKDKKDIERFDAELKDYLEIVSAPNWLDDTNNLKEETVRMIRLSLQIGGDAIEMGKPLYEFQQAIRLADMDALSERKNDTDEETKIKIDAIIKLDEFVNNTMGDFNNEFVMQVHRDDSPIKDDELASSILSESEEIIAKFSRISIRHSREQRFKQDVINVAKDMQLRGECIPLLEEKLALFELKVSDGIVWSSNPGCFEKHLQRKSNNPLFDPDKRKVSQKDVDIAREHDLKDANEIKERIKNITSEFNNFVESKSVTFNQMGSLREAVDESSELIYKVGGPALAMSETLKSLRNDIIDVIKEGLTRRDDKEALEALDKAEDYHYNEMVKFHDTFLQQVMRHDSPITPELIPSVLSENIETIKLFCNTLSNEKLLLFKDEVVKLVNKVNWHGEKPLSIKEKMVAIGVD